MLYYTEDEESTMQAVINFVSREQRSMSKYDHFYQLIEPLRSITV